MADRIITTKRGTCKACGRNVASSAMWTHLKKHVVGTVSGPVYIIRVYGGPQFWMYLQVPGNHTLYKLDEFLRDTWLECCGHLSMFTINGVEYESTSDDSDFYRRKASMKYPINKVLTEKTVFRHEYDYGTTTELRLEVKAAGVPPIINKKGIVPVALHDKVRFVCDVCGRDATGVCGFCTIFGENSLLCDDCMLDHPCQKEEPIILPTVQSPRVGMCGFDLESPLHA